ncbi:MAG: D-alanine--D-alanine ligase, partial [Actinomycetota bacterium]
PAWDADPGRWSNAIGDLGFPCFVKPAHLGSSVGVSRVTTRGDIAPAMDRAFHHDELVIVEAFGGPRELEVGVIDGEPPTVSLPGEIVVPGGFYDYFTKYHSADTELRLPADVSQAIYDRIVDLAVKVFGISRAEGFARVDLFYDPSNDALVVNEINTIPGMTSSSMFPKVWEASGVSFPEVVQRLLDHAIIRHERKLKLEAARAAAHDQETSAT